MSARPRYSFCMSTSAVISSPVGPLELIAGEQGIQSINFAKPSAELSVDVPKELKPAMALLHAYFAKKKALDLAVLNARGTEFQKKVWKELAKVPAGEVITYKELAKRAGKPKAARAVGSAMRKNPFPILVPCHRVLPSNGTRKSPGNYAGGVQKKLWLLEFETKK